MDSFFDNLESYEGYSAEPEVPVFIAVNPIINQVYRLHAIPGNDGIPMQDLIDEAGQTSDFRRCDAQDKTQAHGVYA